MTENQTPVHYRMKLLNLLFQRQYSESTNLDICRPMKNLSEKAREDYAKRTLALLERCETEEEALEKILGTEN